MRTNAFLLFLAAMTIPSAARQAPEEPMRGIFCYERDIAEHIAARLRSRPGVRGHERARVMMSIHNGRRKIPSFIHWRSEGPTMRPTCSCESKHVRAVSQAAANHVVTVEEEVYIPVLDFRVPIEQFLVHRSASVCQ